MKLRPQKGHYYGASSPIRQVSGLRLAERIYSADFKTPSHSHAEAYFCLILNGNSRQVYGRKIRVREPSTTTFYPPNELQSEVFGRAGGRLFNIEMDSQWLDHFRAHSVIGEESIDVRGGSLAWLMTRLYHEFRAMDPTSALVIEGLTLEIIAEASRKFTASRNRSTRWLERARDILHEQFADNLTLAGIAKLVDVHPVHLASSFRKTYQCTIGEYRRRLRIEFACRELAKPHSSLAEIALAAGFANQAHFSATFKRHTGTTPAKYRIDALES
jgi:AraC family transcriptional regulator